MIVPYSCPECNADIKGDYTTEKHEAVCPHCSTVSTIPYDWIKPGIILGNGYRIERKLDELSQAKLFLAYQESMDRQVELKILPPDYSVDEEEFKRFKREIKLTATLNHPNVLAAFGAGEDAGIHFLIRQHKTGETLEEYCHREGSMPQKELLKRMLPIADALKSAWQQEQILHRNLKPENVLLTDDGGAMLADLGIAKSMKSNVDITLAGFTVGTPEFMSPEQVRGETTLDCRSDIYSFCILLYRMLTGEVPFEDPSPLMVMQKQLHDTPIPAQFKNNSISTACSMLLDKGLKKDKSERFNDWDEFIAEMKRILKGEGAKTGGKSTGKAKNHKAEHAAVIASHSKKKKKETGKKTAGSGAADSVAQRARHGDVERIARQLYDAKARRTKLLFYILSSAIPVALLIGFVLMQAHREKMIRKADRLIELADGYEKQKDLATALLSLGDIKWYVGEGSEHWREAQKRIKKLKRKINSGR